MLKRKYIKMYNISPDYTVGGLFLPFYKNLLQFARYCAIINSLSYLTIDGGNYEEASQ